jgi:outer membrane protein OmpA-like peptidoglycan-associated protein
MTGNTMTRRIIDVAGWRTAALALIIVALQPLKSAAVEPYDLSVQHFKPTMDARSFVTVERSKLLGTGEPIIGLFMDYARDPLTQSIGGDDATLVSHLVQGTFIVGMGFFHVVELGASVPIFILRGDGDGQGDEPQLSSDGIGDAAVSLKIRILDRDEYPIGVALVPAVKFGSGAENTFISDGQTPLFMPRLVLDWDIGSRVGMAVNIGAKLRDRRAIDQPVTRTDPETAAVTTLQRDDPIVVGNELTFGLGLGVELIRERVDLVLESYGAASLESDAGRATPLEALLALRIFLSGRSHMALGVSRGLLGAYGDPAYRLFAGIIFEPALGDRDQDGIDDDIDQCPDQPEDKDGFQDADGCPDPDNDKDGILDIVDQCPDLPEDMNGYEDRDGCPDGGRDRDRDGILDVKDQCPDEPEDIDGYEDADGCPEADNDNDGILDGDDKCPTVPEDIDGYEDDDGCPDVDNDGDGIPDEDDQCPDDPENFDGVEDEDGCPERARKVVITGEKLEILDKVYFETNKAVIKTESYAILYEVAETLRRNAQIKRVEIQGHTDSRGSDAYNLSLSERRAAEVRRFLIDEGRVESERLESRGYGERQPVDPVENEDAWAKNRRVEFIIIEQDEGP